MNYTELKAQKLARITELSADATEANVAEVRQLQKDIQNIMAMEDAITFRSTVEKVVEKTIMPAIAGNSDEKEHFKAFRSYVNGRNVECRDLFVGDKVLVPTTIDNGIRKVFAAQKGLLDAVNVRSVDGFVSYPMFVGGVSAGFYGEGDTVTTSDIGTGSISLNPNHLVAKGAWSDRMAIGSDEEFVADFVDAFAQALYTTTENALWTGSGVGVNPTGLIRGAGVDGAVATVSVNMNTGSAFVTGITTALGTIDPAVANGATWVVTNAFHTKLIGLQDNNGNLHALALEYLSKNTIYGLPVVRTGATATYSTGTPIASLAYLPQFKVASFGGGKFYSKRIIKDISTDLVIMRFLDSKLGRKGAFVTIKAA